MFIFILCGGVLPACMFVYHMYTLSTETKRGPQISWNWNYRSQAGSLGALSFGGIQPLALGCEDLRGSYREKEDSQTRGEESSRK